MISWYDSRLGPVKKDDEVVAVTLMGIDITESKQAEDTLRKSESRLATAQEIGLIGTWNLDIVNDVLEWTEQNYKIFGVKQETSMKVGDFFDLIHPDDRDYVSEKWTAGMKGEEMILNTGC